jgi:pimeloyl-ACP methyl ester carboxylesterase
MERAGALEYEMHGAGEAVLCIHGAIVADSFVPLMAEPALAGYRLIRYRRRGYGMSDPPTGAPTIEAQADDARELLGYLGVAQAHVVAHSGGGPIAIQLAIDAPELVRSLVLLEAALQNAAWAAAFHELITPLIDLHRGGESAKAVHLWMRSGGNADWRREIEQRIPNAGEQAAADAAGTFEYDLEAMRHWDFEAVGAQNVTQPVLDVVGSRTAEGRKPVSDMLHAVIPDADLVTIPDADHSLHMTQPAVLAKVIAAFIDRYPIDAATKWP